MEEILELLLKHKRITFELMSGGRYRVTVGRPGLQSTAEHHSFTGAMGQALRRVMDSWPQDDE